MKGNLTSKKISRILLRKQTRHRFEENEWKNEQKYNSGLK